MDDPAKLSATFLDAFNRRDLDLIEQMVASPTDYKRAGVGSPTLTTPAEVRARYEQDFAAAPDIHATLVQVIAATDEAVAFEITVATSFGTVTGAAHHHWVDGKMTRYRSWTDPLGGR
jgi:hypothetical protein